ncbi:MAG: leucyl aminopeptidase family protein [Alphaproteobacteria bacterium]|nr:leucyl aminopeptidase family protein [Alphaproteobacteria bacterium]
MQSYLSTTLAKTSTPLELITKEFYKTWLKSQPDVVCSWLQHTGFKGDVGKYALLPNAKGEMQQVIAVVADKPDIWSIATLADALPEAHYALNHNIKGLNVTDLALGWQLATYNFDTFKAKKAKKFATLCIGDGIDVAAIEAVAEAIFMARDLINRPANDLTPYALADAAHALAKKHNAQYAVVKDDALLTKNYPLIHAVGRASDNRPCLVDMRWGNEKHPKVTLVGKGICFDSGGLDIKPSSGMLMMKKDMGGAANVLALAHMIMALKLPVCLRVMIPAAENSVSGNAFRPKDIIQSRKGITVEIGNTDAEGRLVLCDALSEADDEKPDMLIDFATLTGAARVALGTDMPAFFTNDDVLANDISNASTQAGDPLWRLPIWEPYREMLDSDVADISNAGSSGFGGAITAALYLKEFVEHTASWVHIDLMAWNVKSRPGRPVGGEAMGIRAIYQMLQKRYGT